MVNKYYYELEKVLKLRIHSKHFKIRMNMTLLSPIFLNSFKIWALRKKVIIIEANGIWEDSFKKSGPIFDSQINKWNTKNNVVRFCCGFVGHIKSSCKKYL